ncbi:MAG TPA: AAA family ATPase [Candidatus Hydrogenedentes bacterium]|nr:AAA family ATPase [Candidatus Hydrogenedentota bacterium]HPG70141.1 AAA family ATPase [Candidatus Hydrogenedentota bacterium]
MARPVFLSRVVLSNYKSIKECSVELGRLTFLVGPNGAGKSNFLDALRLVAESLNTSIEHALRERGGINEVRRRSSGHPTHFGVRLEWNLPNETSGYYAFRVGARKNGGFEVQQEKCWVVGAAPLDEKYYNVESGIVTASSIAVPPPASSDRLYLVTASGLADFRPLYDALSHMGFYNLNPDAIRELQPPDPGDVLKRDGSNLAGVLAMMSRESGEARARVIEHLSKVVPGIQGVDVKHVGKKETLEFRQRVGTNSAPWRFMAENMSDGTLRALGVLTALFQTANGGGRRVPFVGIEEPEVAVHPYAAGVLRDGLRIASRSSQVAVTSHSPDLLDDKDVADENILAVVNRNGETRIGPPDEAGRKSIKERLYTAGELLRLNQLEPDQSAMSNAPNNQLDLFAEYTSEHKP